MKTDKEFYKLFSASPQMLFELVGIQTNSIYTMISITLKEFEQRLDGFLEPKNPNAPVFISEFQGYDDDTIYHRIAKAMSTFGENNPKLQVRGFIIFTKKSYDPKTKPWYNLTESKDPWLQVFYLEDILKELEKKNSDHPLVLVFKPYLIDNDNELKNKSEEYYSKLKQTNLSNQVKEKFCSVFVNWLMERFKNLSYKEIITMIEKLTPIEETRAYKEIGELKAREIAKKMLEKGSDIDFVIEVTGLSQDEIKKLNENL